MNNNFSFSNLATASFSSEASQYLKPYEIYKVNLTKIEKTTMQGKKDPSETYPIVTLEFTGVGDNKGIFTQNIFIPNKDADFVRNENPNSHKPMPSSFDRYQYTLMQIVEAINPAGAQKIKDNASKLKTIDDFTSLVIKALTGKEKVEVYLKLVGQNSNGTIYARLPNPCLIGNDGNPAPLNFINSDETKLFFSNYEIGEMNKYKNAKPTNMSSKVDDINPDTPEKEGDLDIKDLEL